MQLSRRHLRKGKRTVRNKVAEGFTDVAKGGKLGVTKRGTFKPAI